MFSPPYSKVRGSNENRPKISTGDFVRVRPLQEDIDRLNVSRKYYPFIVCKFELTGIILSYKLAGESCRLEFTLPNVEGILYRPDYGGNVADFKKIDILSLLNELRYHVRFSFDRSGLAFTHKGTFSYVLTLCMLLNL